MSGNIDTDCNAKFVSFSDLVNVFKNLYDLRHNDNFLNNFFKNVRNFNKFFLLN